MRAKELEPQTMERLKQHWPVNKTGMLSLVSKIPEEDIAFLCGEDPKDVVRQQLQDCRKCVEDDAIRALNDQYERLEKYAETMVNPSTARGAMELYRMNKPQNDDDKRKAIKEGKDKSQAAMIEYEEIHERLNEYLRSLKDEPEKFRWSKKVIAEIENMEQKMKEGLRKLRQSKDTFWNREDGLFHKAQSEKRKQAEAEAREISSAADKAQKKASQDAQAAETKMIKAEEDARMARELLDTANQERQAAEDEKNRALKEKNRALKERELSDERRKEALEKERTAMKAESNAKLEKQKLMEQKVAIQDNYREVIVAYNKAKETPNADVAWFEPFMKQLAEALGDENGPAGRSTSQRSGIASASAAAIRKASSSSSLPKPSVSANENKF